MGDVVGEDGYPSGYDANLDKNLWQQIKANDPTVLAASWDSYDSLRLNLWEWEKEAPYFGLNTHLKALTLSGVDESRSDSSWSRDERVPLFKGIAENRSIERLRLERWNFVDGSKLSLLVPFFEGNTNLRRIELSGCDLDMHRGQWDFLPPILSKCSLEHIEIHRIPMWQWGADIMTALCGQQQLTKLDLWDCCLCRGSEVLGDFLGSLTCRLEELLLGETDIDDERFEHLKGGLAKNKSLKVLSLCKMVNISSWGWKSFPSCLQIPESALEKVDLRRNDLDYRFAKELGAVLEEREADLKLKNLDISENRGFGSAGWEALLPSYLKSPNLAIEELNLASCRIEDECLRTLGNVLVSNKTLKVLNLSCNRCISAVGWGGFFDLLHNSRSALESLDCSANCIGEGAMDALISCLQKPDSELVTLNLAHNLIDDHGASALATGLANNAPSLKSLDLSRNDQISSEGWVAFFEIMQNCISKVEELFLESIQIDDDGIAALVESLGNIDSLKTIDLCSNSSVSTQGWTTLSSILHSQTCKLRTLKMSRNAIIDDEVVSAFADALVDNDSLSTLELNGIDRITNEGWDALTSTVLDVTTINTIYESNHTLQEVGYTRPAVLGSLLRMNKYHSNVEATRQKILWYHFLCDEGAGVEALVDMNINILPHAMEWIGRGNRAGFEVLYHLLQMIPSLFDSNAHSDPGAGLKRKYSGLKDGMKKQK